MTGQTGGTSGALSENLNGKNSRGARASRRKQNRVKKHSAEFSHWRSNRRVRSKNRDTDDHCVVVCGEKRMDTANKKMVCGETQALFVVNRFNDLAIS